MKKRISNINMLCRDMDKISKELAERMSIWGTENEEWEKLLF